MKSITSFICPPPHWCVDWTFCICGICAFKTCLNTKASDEIRQREKHVVPARNQSERCQLETLCTIRTLSPCFHFIRRYLQGNGKHIWVASFVRLAGYGLTATKIHTCSPGCGGAADFSVNDWTNVKMTHIKLLQLQKLFWTKPGSTQGVWFFSWQQCLHFIYVTRLIQYVLVTVVRPLGWTGGVTFCGVNTHLV